MNSHSGNTLRAAALVLHSLSDEQAEQLRGRLAPLERLKLEQAVAALTAISSGEVLDALERLTQEAARDLAGEVGSDSLREITRPFHSGSPGEDDSNWPGVEGQNRQPGEKSDQPRPLAFLRHVDPQLLSQLIVDEHPEDIALVLVELPADLAAGLLQSFDSILRFSVLRRMCRLEKPNAHRGEELAFQLKLRLQQKLGSRAELPAASQRKGLEAAARAVSLVQPRERRELLQQLRVVDGDLGAEVANQVFEFERLSELSDAQIRLLLKRANTAWWAPALLSTTPDVRERILKCFAKPAAAILKREMKALGEVSQQVAQRAQQEIVATWIRLTGEIG